MTTPTLEAFLAAPAEQVAAVAPKTVMIAITGTRRAATLARVSFQGREYVQWARKHMIRYVDLLFQHGVEHIIATGLVPANLVEHAAVRDRYLSSAVWGMSEPGTLADYERVGCRVRLISAARDGQLKAADDLVRQATAGHDPTRTLWWSFVIEDEDPWELVVRAARQASGATRAELIRALYGEDIPPAGMFLAFGKPIIAADFIPPLLVGNMQCYWSQRPGFSMDEPMLRRIFYDYAYVRPTRTGGERTSRHAGLLAQQAAWETDAVLGVGQKLGGFWYPAPFAGVPEGHATGD